MQMASETVVQGVNLPVEMLELAKKRAASEHRSLSGYVRALIEADLRQEAAETSKPAPETAQQSPNP